MIDLRLVSGWVRAHRWLVGGVGVALSTLALSGALAAIAVQTPTAPPVHSAAKHHAESPGPDLRITPDTPGFTIPGSEAKVASALGGGANPAPASTVPSGSSALAGETQTTREVTPNPTGVGSFAPEQEVHAGPASVETSVPFGLPSGTSAGRATVRYANGTTEWLLKTPVSYADAIAFMRAETSTNGWRITGEPPATSFPAPDGGNAQSQRFYVERNGVRGYVVVTAFDGRPGAGIQIDLLGL